MRIRKDGCVGKLLKGVAVSLVLTAGNVYARDPEAMTQLRAQAAALGVEQASKTQVATPKAAPAASPDSQNEGAEVSALFATPTARKTSATCHYGGRDITVPILRWETGALMTKDASGQEVRKEYQYPIIELGDFQPLGDGGLCWDVCRQVCNGYGVCWLSCTYHCTSQGGEGDPRRP